MRLKNRILVVLCTVIATVSFLHPFSGRYVYAEPETAVSEDSSEKAMQPETGTEETKVKEDTKEKMPEEVKTEETAAEEVKTEKAETKEAAAEEADAKETAPGEAETEKTAPEEVKTEETAAEETKTEKAETKEGAPGETDAKETSPEEANAEEAASKETAQITEDTAEHIAENAVTRLMRTAGSSAGISDTSPQVGQQNRYEYSGAETVWMVPADGYYKITCGGAQGGRGKAHYRYGKEELFFEHDGNGGDVRSCMCLLKKGSVLTLHVGGMGREGKPEYVSNDYLEGTSDNGGYSDGGKGTFKSYRCKDCKGSVRAGGGGGGGSSYILYQGVKIISAKGGNGGDAQANGEQGRITIYKSGAAGGGTTARSDADGIRWLSEEPDTVQSGAGSGNGYITITAAAIFPGIKLTASTEEWTNKDVMINAEVKNAGEGLPEQCFSWETDEEGGPVWTSEARITVSGNGTYTCKIRDKEGNIGEKSITVSNIDKLSPDAELNAGTKEWTNGDVTISAAGRDAAATSAYGQSGLADICYSWAEDENGSPVWTGESRYQVSENGNGICKVRDRAGNVTELPYHVGQIDRTPPEVSCKRIGKWYKGSMKVLIEARDVQPDGSEGCGLDEKAYSLDGIHFGSGNELLIEKEGTYSIWVRDRLGNGKESRFTFLHDRKESGDHSEKEETKENPEEKEVLENEAEPLPFIIPAETGEVLSDGDSGNAERNAPSAGRRKTEPYSLPTVLDETGDTMEAPEGKENAGNIKKTDQTGNGGEETQEQDRVGEAGRRQKRDENRKKAVILYSIWMAVILCGLLWLLFSLLMEHAAVYIQDEKGKYRKIGLCMILRKKGYKQVNLIPLMRMGERRNYKVRFSSAFVFFHKKERLLIRTDGGVELRTVVKEIEIFSCNS